MGDILSFSKARKAKARADKESQAAENRVKFGRTKAEKDLAKGKTEQAQRLLDAHRRKDGQD